MSPLLLPLIVILLYALKKVYVILIRPELSPVSRLPGPKRSSFLWGCMEQIFSDKPGAWHMAMFEEYGDTFSHKGFMNTNRLCTVDPRALHHILSRTDIYEKPDQVRRGIGRILGKGLLFSEGDDHRRQRKIMNPSFSAAHIRSLVPIMYAKSQAARDVWLASIPYVTLRPDLPGKPKAMVNVLDTLARMALDIIGLAGFDYHFDALNNAGAEKGEHGDELAQAFASVNYQPKRYRFWNIIINWFPILYKIPTASERRIQNAIDTLQRIGGQLIESKKAAVIAELSPSALRNTAKLPDINVRKDLVQGKDFLSLLIRANMARDLSPTDRLSDAQVMSQISTFVAAGHETTSISLSWTLYALALHPHVQNRLREEVLTLGSDEPSLEILEALPYLDAIVREALRHISVLPNSIRICMKDDIIPIEDGSRGIKIKRGDGLNIPIVALNRLKGVWGDDAGEFKPERWLTPMPEELKKKQKQIPSVYSNLMTFTGGPRSCIGWKFSVVEMKCALFTFVRAVKFSLPPGQEVVESSSAAVITRPLVKGRESEGNQLPLFVERAD